MNFADDYDAAAKVAIAAGPDREFERQMLVAHLRMKLIDAAVEIVERYRRGGLPLCAAALAAELELAVAAARPRSRLVPWHLGGDIVSATIACVAAEVTHAEERS